jgi:hypothetical protein
LSSPDIRRALLESVKEGHYSVAERAIHAIGPADLEAYSFQADLLYSLDAVNYSLRKPILNKFKEAPEISSESRRILADKVGAISGELTGTILDVFAEKQVYDVETCRTVARLLHHENVYISRQAYAFLNRPAITDKKVKKELDAYAARHALK